MSTDQRAQHATGEVRSEMITAPPIWERRKNLKPPEARDYLLTMHGLDYSTSTLAKWRCLGGGPRFLKPDGSSVLYPVDLLEAWALARLGQPVASTSELPSKSKDAA